MLDHMRPELATDSVSGSPLERARALLAPRLAVRVLARLRAATLDRALSEGISPDASPLIAARAAQLSRPSSRTRIAIGLERVALSCERSRGVGSILPARAAVLANRPQIIELARTLRDDCGLYVRGIAMLEATLTDGTGPLYTDRHGDALGRRLKLARIHLAG